jgi:hypothetical protein
MSSQLFLLSKIFQKSCMFRLILRLGTILAPSFPSELPAELLTNPLVWVCRDGPYAVLRRGPCSFTIRVRARDKVVAISRLKACTAVDTTPGSPHHRGRPRGSRPGGPAATKRVSYSDQWFLHLLLPWRRHKTVLEPFSYLVRRFLHARDRWHLHSLHRRGTRLVNKHCPRG